jgi:hypothetical protein
VALWWIFSLDSRTLNKISVTAALRLPTSKALLIRWIWAWRSTEFLTSFKNQREKKNVKIYSEVCTKTYS